MEVSRGFFLNPVEAAYWEAAQHLSGKLDRKAFIKAVRRQFPFAEHIKMLRKNMVVELKTGELFAYSGSDTNNFLKLAN